MFCSYNFTTYTHYILYDVCRYSVDTGKGVEGGRRGDRKVGGRGGDGGGVTRGGGDGEVVGKGGEGREM